MKGEAMKTCVNKSTQQPVGNRQSRPLIKLLMLGLAALLWANGQTARAQWPEATQAYTIQVIEPPEGTVAVWWTFINESGLVAMQYWLPDDPLFLGHTAILEKGEWRNIDVPGSVSTGVSSPLSRSTCRWRARTQDVYLRFQGGLVISIHRTDGR